jgi:ubiquinone/menaquinone biosynthesis C-methylase UbiE
MAEFGAKVTAIDFSENFIAIAKSKDSRNIEYKVMDATSETDLEKLNGNNFDSIVCTMALMDMEDIGPLINHFPRLLKKDGVFIFSTVHPCFNSGDNTLTHERCDLGGEVKDKYFVKISNYLIETKELGIGMLGQPKPQYYFHRPISTILRHLFENGFVLDAFEEPSFTSIENSNSIFDNIFKHTPPVLICRMRISDCSK